MPSESSIAATSGWVRVLVGSMAVLVIGIPYAITRGTLPLDGAAWLTAEGTRRIVLLAMALGIALLSIVVALICTLRREKVWTSWSLASVAFLLGFGCYPLWLNGVGQATDRVLYNELDPKRVAPYLWFRECYSHPQALYTLGMLAVLSFTPFITKRVIIRVKREGLSWDLIAESALPLCWLFLLLPILEAWGWSFD